MTNQMVSAFETDIVQVSNGGGTHALRESEQWDDLFMRHTFADTGLYPTSGTLSASPDIIPAGLSPYADPSQLIADTNWAKDFGSSADSEIPNYIYLRGRNLGGAQTEGKLYLYAARASLLMYPTNPLKPSEGWSQNPLKTQKGA